MTSSMDNKRLITREILEIVLYKYTRIDSDKINKLFCDRCKVIVIDHDHDADIEDEKYTSGVCDKCGVTLCFPCQSIKHCYSCLETYCKSCFGARDECTSCVTAVNCYDCKKIYDPELLGTEGHECYACAGCGNGLCDSCRLSQCVRCPDSYCRSCFESGKPYYCPYCGDEDDRIE